MLWCTDVCVWLSETMRQHDDRWADYGCKVGWLVGVKAQARDRGLFAAKGPCVSRVLRALQNAIHRLCG